VVVVLGTAVHTRCAFCVVREAVRTAREGAGEDVESGGVDAHAFGDAGEGNTDSLERVELHGGDDGALETGEDGVLAADTVGVGASLGCSGERVETLACGERGGECTRARVGSDLGSEGSVAGETGVGVLSAVGALGVGAGFEVGGGGVATEVGEEVSDILAVIVVDESEAWPTGDALARNSC
jgi:hypothetical protein